MPILRDEYGRVAIESTHPDYDLFINDWNYIDRVVTGRGVETEILTLNPRDTSDENRDRNVQYKERAVFYRIAGRTVNRMVGLVFVKWPTLNVPIGLDYIADNVDGVGSSIYQQSQAVLKSVIAKGRAGILVEYPEVNMETTKYDMMEGKYFATIQRFEPQQIINWSLVHNGASMQLGRVVLRDTVQQDYETIGVIRELTLEYINDPYNPAPGMVYRSKEYRYDEEEQAWKLYKEATPLDGFGMPWNEIPFTFIGAETNQPKVDEPPMLDICKGNVCHYRLHADYMDNCHYVGQPQGYVSGVEDVKGFIAEMKESGWYTGSRQMAVLPPGGTIGFAAVPSNTLIKEALDGSKNDLLGMGAFYITPGSAVKTAAQAEGEQEEQHSILSLAAVNISEAYTRALLWMCRYMKIPVVGAQETPEGKMVDDTPIYDLRRDFIRGGADPALIQTLWTLVMQGGMPQSDFWAALRKAELIDPEKGNDEIKDEIEAGKAGGGAEADTFAQLLAEIDAQAMGGSETPEETEDE